MMQKTAELIQSPSGEALKYIHEGEMSSCKLRQE